jgi:hypothetical protein
MTSYTKIIVTLIAVVNLLVAAVSAMELWGFYHGLDRLGLLQNTKDEEKTRMLRTIHYWGIPPVILLTGTSRILFWKLRRGVES